LISRVTDIFLQVSSIWFAGKDLINPRNPVEVRHSGFQLLTACVQHGYSTDLERKEYFDTLTSRLEPDDFHLQLASLVELAKHGKDLSGFHYEAIPLLTRWLRSAWEILEEARKQARLASSKVGGQSKAPFGEETNLNDLFDFIIDVIKFSFVVSSDDETNQLIDGALYIALHARSPDEILSCVRVLDAIVTYSSIPNEKLQECIKVLCSIYCIVPQAKEVTWRTIRNLCKSHNGHTTVSILMNILRETSMESVSSGGNTREIRGALLVVEKIMSKDGRNNWPVVPFALLMEVLSTVLTVEHAKVESDVLRLILSLFDDDPDSSNENIMEEDWSLMFEIAAKCSLRASETSDGRRIENARSRGMSPAPTSTTGSVDNAGNVATSMAQMLYKLIIRIEELINSSPVDFLQRDNCMSFFLRVNAHLPESCAKLVIEYNAESRLCYPSEPNWKNNIEIMLEAFFSNRSRPSQVRLLALKAVTDVYEMVEMMDDHQDPDATHNFVSSILVDLAEERDVTVLQEVIAFAVSVADTAETTLFDYIIKQLHQSVSTDQLNSPASIPGSRLGSMGSQPSISAAEVRATQATPANVVTRGIVQIFMRTMETSSSKALRTFDEVLWIAKSSVVDTDARLSAMKMLFRLRADWANRIFLTPFTEAQSLAASLYRTHASLAAKQAEEEAQLNRTSRVPDDSVPFRNSRSSSSTQLNAPFPTSMSRSVSGVSRTVQRNHQMWMTPDLDPLPEEASDKASMLLVSIIDETEDASISEKRKPLKINIWLETIVGLLKNGCDWEVYSYILVHLPSQLTNQALFKGAIPEIKLLRKEICQQIRDKTFHEPPVSSGLRKSDVSICLFQVLNMVTSYHQYFSRNEEDEIVKTFIQGLNPYDKAAKPCIHALLICCHELPNSMKLVLVNIIQKMSQIITQAHVAVHILEFLATLARIPDLYAHFREDDYRIIFGICFRYLQYVRDQDAKLATNRNSNTPGRNVNSPVDMSKSVTESSGNDISNTKDDLPQYVYALAYHVITFWFLSLRLSDRANQVTWIIRNLVWTDPSGKQNVDEQSQVTINFLQRTAYADVDESAADPTFTEARFGEILKKRWLIGHSIVTIEQATRGGWAQITKRQPSGTSHYMIREKFERPPAHQILNTPESKREAPDSDPNVVRPSHLLVQLGAPSPLNLELTRPIPLPDDDMIRRAISSFDHNPTVDCHKVGIIYIGENQTQEVEILANVMGSSDYTDFLSGIGTLSKLQGATFNTAGLDRQYNTDGEYTFCWRDRVTEMIFHVTTLMPTNLEHDPQCANKKRHIGNDFVNIIFNNSGIPFRFDTFPSAFNYVNIVITPESRASFVATRLRSESYSETAFYKVQVMSKEGFPEISPAAETKIISLRALPEFIRLLALNASVFSLVWYNRAGGEHVSSWRNRLREISRLREKYGSKHTPTNSTTSPPSTAHGNGVVSPDSVSRNVRESMASLRRSSVATFLTNTSDDRGSKHFSTADTEVGSPMLEDNMIDSLDFSKWA
jgi:hypothetical protein